MRQLLPFAILMDNTKKTYISRTNPQDIIVFLPFNYEVKALIIFLVVEEQQITCRIIQPYPNPRIPLLQTILVVPAW